jgi:uncharacterized transporter YbjL
MYGVGLRVGPSFINSLKGDGLKFTVLAVFCSILGLFGAVAFSKLWDLPAGAAGGILAGSMTMSASIGSAEEAVKQGVFKLAEGQTFEQVSGMIALSYGLTYIWGTVGIILICKYLPRWWGIDARAEAKKYEDQFGVRTSTTLASLAIAAGAACLQADQQSRHRHDGGPVPAEVSAVQGDQCGARRRALRGHRQPGTHRGRRHRARRPARRDDREHGPDRP